MTKEQIAALCMVIRSHERLRIDNMLLSAMLVGSQATREPPTDWLKELRILRELPAHRAALEETEWLVSQVQHGVDEDALMKLISSIPKSTLPD